MTGTPQNQAHHDETGVLPAWLYPAFFWAALPVLLVSTFVSGRSSLGLWYMMAIPALAALVVAMTQWRRDRRVSWAALIALAGLGLVVLVKNLIGAWFG